ncbi:threonine dehydratase [Saccharomonospora sp. CUA-673]|uniref:threonine ammonia-lyase n=1 Tax=Saccharomonospora sp. CUA-673 TaxID=1904969 RepID=UPI00096929D4|nr:threonine/serine dehydratase [Saccharomonospora sp. CUA-673]OLT46913.1 threonine dehydratase [Saccharomonospora sp. CUA-673]
MQLVSLDDIRLAADRVRGRVLRTPLLPAPWAADASDDRPLWVKPESLQAIGAFKLRGAINALAALDEPSRARGVVAYSSGNHAQAVAYAARQFGVTAHIVMPEDTPRVKVDGTRRHGAEVVLVPLAERESTAYRLVDELGAVLVPPFDHPDIIAGQGTAGLEIAEDLPDVELVLVPVSGGGLASGIGTAVKALCPNAAVFGVEPDLAADAADSLRAGHIVEWPAQDRARTIADGLRAQPSELTFAHLQAVLDGIVTVTDGEIRAAMRMLATGSRLIAEPSGAVPLAAYLHRADQLPRGRTVVVVSGGNVDREVLADAWWGDSEGWVPRWAGSGDSAGPNPPCARRAH